MKWSNKEVELLKKDYADSSNLELSKTLNRSSKAISKKASSLGLTKKINNSYDEDELKKIIEKSSCYADVFRYYGKSKSGDSYKNLKFYIQKFNISIKHFDVNAAKTRRAIVSNKYNLVDVLVENSPYKTSSNLKKRLINEGYLKNECSECGLKGTWNGKPISLQMDHINGINNDNRLVNLRILCPNCHSQTKTYSGKNNKKHN